MADLREIEQAKRNLLASIIERLLSRGLSLRPVRALSVPSLHLFLPYSSPKELFQSLIRQDCVEGYMGLASISIRGR